MPQQRDVYRKPKAIFIPPPGSDQTMIVPAGFVVPFVFPHNLFVYFETMRNIRTNDEAGLRGTKPTFTQDRYPPLKRTVKRHP